MAQPPARVPPPVPSSLASSISATAIASQHPGQHSGQAPAVDPQQQVPMLSYRLPLRFRVELSFDTLFDGKGDRLETVQAWLAWLPPLAATLHQLSLADMGDDARHQRALHAIRAGADPCASDLRYGRTVLHWACLLAQPSLVGLLLQHGAGAQPDQPDAQGCSPLGCVASLRTAPGSAQVVGLLLSAGASPAALPNRGAALLYLADLDVALARQLLGAGVPVDGDPGLDSTPLLAACSHGSWEVAALLLQAGAQLRPGGPLRMSPLHYPEIPVWLAAQLQQRGADLNARDLLGETPLMLACAAGNVPLARWLIDAGASTDAVSDEGLRAIDHAIRHRDGPLNVRGIGASQQGRPAHPPTDG